MIEPLGRLGAAATLRQHCPQMTQRPGTYLADPVLAARRPLQQEAHPLVERPGLAHRPVPAGAQPVAQVRVVRRLKALRELVHVVVGAVVVLIMEKLLLMLLLLLLLLRVIVVAMKR